ncbi:MAG TPA: NUDIX hydrolase [Candidatus Deferrimicrobium sp.]|nr:NUDIX hydrolase [Candidatus Deferrimicrobium sp.]
MQDKELREVLVKQEVMFQGRMIRLDRDTVRLPNGAETTREVVRHPGAVAVVALKDDSILLVRQYRYPIDQITLEIPAGKLDKGEAPLACAERELREETGYSGKLTFVGKFYSTAGFSDEIMHLFLATELVWNPLAADDDEFLSVVEIPWQEALAMAQQSKFIDAKTILGILMAQGRM